MSWEEDQELIKNAKDCTFCGSPAGHPYLRTEGKMFQVCCNFCGASGPTSDTKKHAVMVWNAKNPIEYFDLLRNWYPDEKEVGQGNDAGIIGG